MRPAKSHSLDVTNEDAIHLQSRLASKVVLVDELPSKVRLIAGVDVAYDSATDEFFSAIVVCDADTLRTVEATIAEGQTAFGYVPGLFSLREIPALMRAFEKMKATPDLVICDGQGIAHPRRFGMASHLGVLYNLATIGCAKTRLIGTAPDPGIKRGDWSELRDQNQIIGAVLRTQDAVRPVYVSQGHRISLQSAREWVLRASSKYRLPEPIREANRLVHELRARHLGR